PAPAPVTRTVVESEARTVYFDFDDATLPENAESKLASLAAVMKAATDVKSAKIVGHADRKGSSSYNEQLSLKRAETVKNYLAQNCYLNTSIAEVRGVGKTQPVSDCEGSMARNQEIACLSPDRRVEVEIEYFDTQTVSQAQ